MVNTTARGNEGGRSVGVTSTIPRAGLRLTGIGDDARLGMHTASGATQFFVRCCVLRVVGLSVGSDTIETLVAQELHAIPSNKSRGLEGHSTATIVARTG